HLTTDALVYRQRLTAGVGEEGLLVGRATRGRRELALRRCRLAGLLPFSAHRLQRQQALPLLRLDQRDEALPTGALLGDNGLLALPRCVLLILDVDRFLATPSDVRTQHGQLVHPAD